MPYLYEGVSFLKNPLPDSGFYVAQGTSPRSFRVALLNHLPDYGSLRWTVDTPADLEFVRQVFSRFESQDGFGWRQVLALLEKEPDLASINSEVKHNSAFDVDERSSHP
jgi:spore coat polysaccharide biosynthesis protein SpsF